MRRRRDADSFFQDFWAAAAVEDAEDAEDAFGWTEAETFFAELTGALGEGEDAGEAAPPGPIDAVVRLPSGKAYFFYGADYVRYDVKADKADAGYPKPIKGNWPGLWEKDVDAGIEWGNGKLYFFKGKEYVRYDITADAVDPGYPKPIKGNWPGLFEKDIDAAVNWGNGKAYFFRGDEYIRYDIAAGTADAGYPKKIAPNWPGLFARDLDDGVNWGNGKAYFFKGDEYVRFDIATDKVDPGFPAGIIGKWPGLHPASTCTCTDSGRKYSFGLVPTANLIGAQSCIKTRYGKLCCEGTTATSWAFSSAWTGVTRPGAAATATTAAVPTMWAQIGYRRMRTGGGTAIKTYRYWEVFGTIYNSLFEPASAPSDNVQHTYLCEVDTTSGKWTFNVDGASWKDFTDAAWVGTTGTRADYVGEILNETDDMPGTASNKCTFRECKKKSTGGSWVAAGLTSTNVGSSNAAEWGATRVSSTDMDIWDINPLP